METEDHREDTLVDLMCGYRDIFSQDSLRDSQLERVAEASTPVDPVVPPRDKKLLKLWSH